MALIFDIETDGFLENCTKIHCLVIKNTETGEVFTYDTDFVDEGAKMLADADLIIGHNIIKFDVPVIKKLYPWFTIDDSKLFDTLVCTRLIWSNIKDWDSRLIHQGKLPSKLWGSHKLEAWGYRVGENKGEYTDWFKQVCAVNGITYVEGDEWKTYCQEMLDYCVQDVVVTEKLYQRILDKKYDPRALQLEHETAHICARMERNGWPFNKAAASALYAELSQKRSDILADMQATFEPLVIERVSEKTGKQLKPKIIEFNPGSRPQIANRLITKYGWKPREFTAGGDAKIDEDILGKLPYPEAAKLAEYFMLDKRIGQLAEGDNAWLKLERNGFVHGSIITNGAVTGRATHNSPNMAQVPSVRAAFGKQCRSLFTVLPGFSQVGTDLSGLELRCLAHYMAKWDNGEYIEELLNGDIHTKNQTAAGLPTRDNAKTFIYSFLYGAGDEKIGAVVGKGAAEGKRLKEAFLKATPALARLREAVATAAKRGYLLGLDGRHLHVRSEHAALNTLLQSAGALISKQWLIEIIKGATEKGWKYGWDGDFVLLGWIHDEVQSAVRKGLEDEFGQMVVEAAKRAGEFFEFRCPIGAEFKVGKDWAECH